MNPKFGIGLSAAFGGIAPNLFRVATELTGGKGLPEWSYVIGVLMFASIGAATALAFGENDSKKAFFLGLGLPALFQSAAQDVSTAAARLQLTPVVYAWEEPERIVTISWQGDVDPETFSLIYGGEKTRRRVKDDFVDPEHFSRGRAPRWMRSVQVVIGDAKTGPRSDWVDVPRGRMPVHLILTVDHRPLTGLQKAVGIRGVQDYSVELEIDEPPEPKRE